MGSAYQIAAETSGDHPGYHVCREMASRIDPGDAHQSSQGIRTGDYQLISGGVILIKMAVYRHSESSGSLSGIEGETGILTRFQLPFCIGVVGIGAVSQGKTFCPGIEGVLYDQNFTKHEQIIPGIGIVPGAEKGS